MMKDRNRKPDKIDMEDVLGGGTDAEPEPGDIEILDPGADATTEPVPRASMPPAGSPGSQTSPGEELAAALAERDKYYDQWVRARADFENFRKRIDREREEEKRQAGAALARDLLPVLDNLERALAGPSEGAAFREGVALIHRQLRDALSGAGLEPIEALGETFNPVFHEAVATERTDRFEANRVIEEVRKGYTFRNRVLRPSLVKVAVAPETAAEKGETGAGSAGGPVGSGGDGE